MIGWLSCRIGWHTWIHRDVSRLTGRRYYSEVPDGWQCLYCKREGVVVALSLSHVEIVELDRVKK